MKESVRENICTMYGANALCTKRFGEEMLSQGNIC